MNCTRMVSPTWRSSKRLVCGPQTTIQRITTTSSRSECPKKRNRADRSLTLLTARRIPREEVENIAEFIKIQLDRVEPGAHTVLCGG